jgi:hypothetical protein
MNVQEKQLIDLLFSKLQETGSKSGPRDAQAESHINRLMAQIPGAGYFMAQAIIVQQQALKHAAAKIAQLEQQGGRSQGFLPSQPTGTSRRIQPSQPTAQAQGSGFLAGAAQTAVGIGGGILLANAGMALFDDMAYGDAFDAVDAYDDGTIDAATDNTDDLDLGDALDDFGFDDW